MDNSDIAIIGAGPAGLAAADLLSCSGHDVVLIDSGKQVGQRDRYVAEEITRGHGGAGLFSDGKFSFFPSASNLWLLPHSTDLHAAYDWTCSLLQSYNLDTPPFPDDANAYTAGVGEWVLKEYPSDYLSLEARIDLTSRLIDAMDCSIIAETEVIAAEYERGRDVFELTLLGPGGHKSQLQARRILIATGRFGPLGLSNLSKDMAFRRLEVGFRIEQPADRAFFRDMKQLDPKLTFRQQGGSVEWRTFCACRNGETALTETHGLWTVSGRADGPPTGRSNIGFNTRITDEEMAARTLPPMLAAISDRASHFALPLDGVIAGEKQMNAVLDRVYGPELRELMVRGLYHLESVYPGMRDTGTRLIGPTLEGVGWYIKLDGDLRFPDAPAWVAGDACGLFRGIVAAMISGRYAAASLLRNLETPDATSG